MATSTTYYGLAQINRSSEATTKTVGSWIDDVNGTTSGNMQKIDAALHSLEIDKADIDLSNVANEDFEAKAKSAGVAGEWGSITGILTNQIDLTEALDNINIDIENANTSIGDIGTKLTDETSRAIKAEEELAQSLDDEIKTVVKKSGDVMTGSLVLNGSATDPLGAVPKQQLEDGLAQLSKQALTYKGYISASEPTIDLREGNSWLQVSLAPLSPPDMTFPWEVKNYTSGAWPDALIDYTPIAMDLWYDIDNNEAWYYIGNSWERLDFTGSTFDSNFFNVVSGSVSLKDGGITNAKIATNAEISQSKISGLTAALDGKAPSAVNSLTSTSTTAPLSAAQGKALNDNKANLSVAGATSWDSGNLPIEQKTFSVKIYAGDTAITGIYGSNGYALRMGKMVLLGGSCYGIIYADTGDIIGIGGFSELGLPTVKYSSIDVNIRGLRGMDIYGLHIGVSSESDYGSVVVARGGNQEADLGPYLLRREIGSYGNIYVSFTGWALLA